MIQDIQNAKCFTIMTDQSADIANKEQWVVCFCCVDDDFEIHEDLIGVYPITKYKSWHYCYDNFGYDSLNES